MSFSLTEKAEIRKFMGVSSRVDRWTHSSYPIELALDDIGDNDLETATIIRTALAELTAIDAKMTSLYGLAHVTGADEAKLSPAIGLHLLKAEGRRKIRVLANAIGLTPRGDYFSGALTMNDASERYGY